MMEYFNVAKSVWSIVFESLDMKIRRSKKYISNPKGFFYFIDEDKTYHVWEYSIKKETKTNPQQMTNVKLIYSGPLNDLTISKIITRFSSFFSLNRKDHSIIYNSF
jgi:hypothetical protein